MKKLVFLISIMLVFGLAKSQSFSTPITPSSRTMQMGTTVSNVFTINVVPSGGFNSSVNYSLSVPPQLDKAVSISTTLVNTPYPPVFINVNKYFAPEGTFTLDLKSFNGSYEIHTVCTLVISHNDCPDWFTFQEHNSPVPSTYGVCTGLDKTENFWVGSFGAGTSGSLGSLACFDKNTWHVWSTQDYRVYNASGAITSSTTTQKIMDSGVKEIATYGDSVYAISDFNIYSVINKSVAVLSAPQTTAAFENIEVDNNGSLWVATHYQLYHFTGGSWTPFNLSTAPFTTSTLIKDFEIDHKGHVWFAAGSLHKFDGTFWTTYNSTSGLTQGANVVQCAKNGIIWVGPYNSAVVYRFNAQSSTFTAFQYGNPHYVESITFDPFNNPVVGGTSGIAVLNGTAVTSYNNLNSAIIPNGTKGVSRMASVDSHGNMLVANRENGIVYHCAENTPPTGIVQFGSVSSEPFLFPNPASNSFRIVWPEFENEFLVLIFDAGGKEVYRRTLVSGGNVNMDLSSGLYLVRIMDTKTSDSRTTKLVISR